MSVSVYMQAVIPHDAAELQRMRDAKRACDAAGVAVPDAVDAFLAPFEDGEASDRGYLRSLKYDVKDCVEGDVEYDDGAYIDLSKLPKGTTHIRVSMS